MSGLSAFQREKGWSPGGAPLQIYYLASELAKDNAYEVFMWGEGKVVTPLVDNVHLVSSKLWPLFRVPLVARIARRWATREMVPQYARNAIIVFAGRNSADFLANAKLARAQGARCVFRLSSDYDAMASNPNGDYAQALCLMDAIIVQTEHQKQELLRNYALESVLIAPSFPVPQIRGNIGHPKYVLWVGLCHDEKQPEKVFELAQLLPDVPFLMICSPVRKDYAKRIKHQAEALPNVTCLSQVEPDKIQPYFDESYAVINTSKYEGFPNTLHQAAIAGVPYVSLNWNADDYLTMHDIGTCAEGSLAHMARDIERFVTDSDERVRVGANAYRFFEERGSFERVAKEYKDVFRYLSEA